MLSYTGPEDEIHHFIINQLQHSQAASRVSELMCEEVEDPDFDGCLERMKAWRGKREREGILNALTQESDADAEAAHLQAFLQSKREN
jgi:hypothetical protein